MSDEQSLFEKYGGWDTVSGLVRNFYDKVLRSDVVGHYFNAERMAALIDHQTRFLAAALGGPTEYDGRTMADAHEHLGISEDEFGEVAELLVETLEDAGVSDEDIEAIVGIVGGLKGTIVNAA